MANLGVRVEAERAIIEIPSDLHSSKAEDILMWIKEFKDSSVRSVVFDFEACRHIDLSVYPIFGRIKMEFTRQGLQFFSINMDDRLYARVTSDGVNALFALKKGVISGGGGQSTAPPVQVAPAPQKTIFSVEYLNLMIEELTRALRASNVEAQCGKPFLKTAPVFEGLGVIGVMPLSSSGLKGAIRLSAPRDFAIALHKDLFGQEVNEASDEAIELLEEITDVFFKYLREKFGEKGIPLMNAAPSVLVGLPANLQQSETAKTMVLPFTSTYGKVFLEVVLA